MIDLAPLAWPLERLHEALAALALRSGLEPRRAELAAPPRPLGAAGAPAVGDWFSAAAAWLGVEAESVEIVHGEAETFLRRAAPAVLRIGDGADARFVALERGGRRRVVVLGPDHRAHAVPLEDLRRALCRPLEEPLRSEVDALLREAGVPERRSERARRAILDHRLAQGRIAGCWLLRLRPGAGLWRQIRHGGLRGLAASAIGAHLGQQLLVVLSWWMLGRGVLQGRLEGGWLAAWGLLLLSMTPLRGAELWSLAKLTTRAGALLKRRLLAGVLRLEPEEIRHQGIGQFLGRVIDSEAVESLVLSGGHLGLIAAIELVLALPILALGAGGWPHALLLVLWSILAVALWKRHLEARRRWTGRRLGLTHELIEKMVGHRTRLAQERPGSWHDEEDQALESYLRTSREMDRSAALLRAFVPRGWLMVGMLGLAPAFIAGEVSVGRLAVGVGGVLFAAGAFWMLVRGLAELAEATVAWANVEGLFQAAARPEVMVPPELAARFDGGGERDGPLLQASDLGFRYPGRADPVLEGCSVEIRSGDHLLLEGPSGCGKSTLTALLAGLRSPDSGILLLGGLDRQSLGERGWRRRVAAAPQFHENHVLTETFAFNLLMGRDWPPGQREMEEAEAICRELGLGELLERMPAGLLQMVGESGWQLSHGEKSRLFIARALLQDADLVLFDESFAALDPENLRRALDCTRRRAETLLVVAHP